MDFPLNGDYIDIHTHDSEAVAGIYAVENLMAHEMRIPSDIPGRACTYGIHPWHLDQGNADEFIGRVREVAGSKNIIAFGEAGFDRLRGPAPDVQGKAFEAQVLISEELEKPLYIHCVRAWDQLLQAHKRLRPRMPWLIHGFRGNRELAMQLISKGMYISFWFDFIVRKEASALVKSLPSGRIFVETDGAGVDIGAIYEKVAGDLSISNSEMKSLIQENFRNFFLTPGND
jgi:TatD DNase family protein